MGAIMPDKTKVDVTTAFYAGEFTPALAGRIDFQDYKYGARLIENLLPEIQGGLKKFYGTRRIAVIEDPQDYIMVPFDALDDTVVLVFHDGIISVIDGDIYYDTDLSISVPGLKQLNWAQSNAVMYFVHPNCLPFAIRCTGREPEQSKLVFRIEDINFVDVPYFPVGWDGNFNGTITTNAETGTITVTAGSTVSVRLKLPTSFIGLSGEKDVLQGTQVAVLRKSSGSTSYSPSFGDTKVQLVRKRNGVETVVSTVLTGIEHTV